MKISLLLREGGRLPAGIMQPIICCMVQPFRKSRSGFKLAIHHACIVGVVVTDTFGSLAGVVSAIRVRLAAQTWLDVPPCSCYAYVCDRTCHELRIARNKIPPRGKKSGIPPCSPACLTDGRTDRTSTLPKDCSRSLAPSFFPFRYLRH